MIFSGNSSSFTSLAVLDRNFLLFSFQHSVVFMLIEEMPFKMSVSPPGGVCVSPGSPWVLGWHGVRFAAVKSSRRTLSPLFPFVVTSPCRRDVQSSGEAHSRYSS